ncbi:MAG: TIGR00153 family protein [Desulfomonile tiedjei]|uniref:TIGR00153 family protein n=1 Tax=Desulfomonile tiedjei TaxID=2358 RepID=A0A9D6Z183_9BACT|nr:TIGR00153 family protein [Desulfomonile tiedjei]
MRLVLGNLFRHSPFQSTLKHAEKVAQCGPLFLNAVQAYFAGDRARFELLKEDIRENEAEADRMKRNIRGHLPAAILMPVDKSVFFSFLREADKVVDCIKNALYWMSYYRLGLPEDIQRDYVLLAKEVGDYLGFLPEMVQRGHTFFSSRMEQDREAVKEIIREIRFREKESDDLEKAMFIRLCADDSISPKTFFIMIRVVETTGDIADHLENSADMMRVMIAR